MKRSPMKRTSFKKRPYKPIKPVLVTENTKYKYAKKAEPDDLDVEGRAEFVQRILRKRPMCQALEIFAKFDNVKASLVCTRIAIDVHEVLRRSAGGSITDENNVLALCRNCHTWVHQNPKLSILYGLLKSRYAGKQQMFDEERDEYERNKKSQIRTTIIEGEE